MAQDLGTRASASALSSNILGVTGTLSGTLSGTLGQTLTGQATVYRHQQQRHQPLATRATSALAANGQLVFNYGGNWNSTTSGQTGTGSGMIQQMPGTYFTETVTGTAQHSFHFHCPRDELSHRDNLNCPTAKDATSLTGSRTVGNTTSSTTGSIAGMLATVNTPAAAYQHRPG